MTIKEAAAASNLSTSSIQRFRVQLPNFDAEVTQILLDSGVREARPLQERLKGFEGRPPVLTDDARRRVLRLLRAGRTVSQITQATGISVLAIKRARYRDPDFDAAVVAAATAGGRTGFKPLSRPPCPGPKCGTPYGYDTLACREDECRDAKTFTVAQNRARKRSTQA
jgi:hypothetical protein